MKTATGTSNGSRGLVATAAVSSANRAATIRVKGPSHARAAACGSPERTSAAAFWAGAGWFTSPRENGAARDDGWSSLAAHESHPPRARERMDPKRDEAKRHDGEDDAAERRCEQRGERPAEAVNQARVPVEAALEHEPSDDGESHTSRHHAPPAKRVHDLSLGRRHLVTFQIVLEHGAVRVDELPETDADGDGSDRHRDEVPGRVREHSGDGGLRAIVGRRLVLAGEEAEREEHHRAVRDAAPREAQTLRDTGCIVAPVQRVVDRPDEAPQRIRGEADGDADEDDPAGGVGSDRDQASRLVDRLSREAKGQPERDEPHDAVEDTTHDVSDALEELDPGVARGLLAVLVRALDGTLGLGEHRPGPQIVGCHVS